MSEPTKRGIRADLELPTDYVRPVERRGKRGCDCILCSMIFAAAGTAFGWACCYLWMTIG
jgi:hypothetical protein